MATNEEGKAVSDDTDYGDGWTDGIRTCCLLVQAGADVQEVLEALPGDGPADVGAFQQLMAELRLLMAIDSPIFGGDDEPTA